MCCPTMARGPQWGAVLGALAHPADPSPCPSPACPCQETTRVRRAGIRSPGPPSSSPEGGHTPVCTQRVPPNEEHGKGDLPRLQPPQTGLLSPLAWQCQPHGAQSLPPPCLHSLHSKPPKGWLLQAGEERWHHPGHCPWQSSVGHQGTRLHLTPLTARVGTPSRDTVPTHIHQDPSGHSPRGIPVPLPHIQGDGWSPRQDTAAPQAKARMFLNLGQKQQAEGLLIASRGALVCLSILQQTRFAALIPIWK